LNIEDSLLGAKNQYASFFASPLCSVLIHWRYNENRDEKVSLPRARALASLFWVFFFLLGCLENNVDSLVSHSLPLKAFHNLVFNIYVAMNKTDNPLI
jgi:hypothetical protein